MTKLTSAEFVKRNADRSIDLNKTKEGLTAAQQRALKTADVNNNNKIEGRPELRRAFKAMDAFDRNGSTSSVELGTNNRPTPVGKAMATIENAASPTRGLRPPRVDAGNVAGPGSRTITAEGNTFRAHDQTRAEFGKTSIVGNRIISLDSNSVRGRAGEILRPLIIIPNNATQAERKAAQASVNGVAKWLADNNPGERRATTGTVRTTAENGRGIKGFFHTEFFSVNDTKAVKMVRERPEEYARILAGTLGGIQGANFIVPHSPNDPGAVSTTGTTEVSIGRNIIRNGFFALP
jgi:hypothetical protein